MRISARKLDVYREMASKIAKTSSVPRISVIIPFYKKEDYLQECLKKCLELDYPDFEIIVASQERLSLSENRLLKIVTGGASQGEKKNAAIAAASGEICAFIDDDAFPRTDWLTNAANYFEDSSIGAVCGPGLTPTNDDLKQKAGGIIYSSILVGGPFRHRYMQDHEMIVDEAPGYNFFVRRQLLFNVGGVPAKVRSGEDTLLSQSIKAKGFRIVYSPNVVVYHHRRPLFKAHLMQVYNYALHRGYFAKRFGGISRTLSYFLPLLLVSLLAGMAVASFFNYLVGFITLGLLTTYLLLCLGISLRSGRSLKLIIIVLLGIILTHVTYAAGFLRGLFTIEIGEKPSH